MLWFNKFRGINNIHYSNVTLNSIQNKDKKISIKARKLSQNDSLREKLLLIFIESILTNDIIK